MSPPPRLPAELREQIRRRAAYLCEYWHTSELWQYVRFTVDHVVPPGAGGSGGPENLALACFHCNRRKSDKQSALDPQSVVVEEKSRWSEYVSLFNPRSQLWNDHFCWSADGLLILPQTAVARATVALLELNRERILKIRRADVEVGRHPPKFDLISTPS